MTSGFDLFAPNAIQTLLLFGLRVSGLVLIAPVFSARTIPMMSRTGIVVLLVAMMGPIAAAHAVTPLVLTPAVLLSEAVTGFMLGMGAAILVGAAETAGELLGIQIGLQGSALVDPLSRQQTTAIGHFLQLFAIALLLSTKAHVVMLEALAGSLDRIPLGSSAHLQSGFGTMLTFGSTLFALGLQFAAPILAIVMIVNVALAVLSRAAPQLNILALAFPVQILAGLLGLIGLVPLIGAWFLGWQGSYAELVTGALISLAGGR